MAIHLKDLSENEVYLKFDDDFAKEFFDCFIKNFNTDIIFKKLGFKSGIVLVQIYRRNKTAYPLSLVRKICNSLQEIDNKFSLENIEKNIVMIASKKLGLGGSLGGAILFPKFPFNLNSKTTRLISHTLCDGDVHSSGRIRYTNNNYQLIQAFISDLKVLGKVEYKEGYDSAAHRVYLPKIVKLILDKLGLDDTSYNFILKTDRENKIVFIQAAFDDEGSVNLSGLRLSMSSIDKRLLEIIQELLKTFGIISRVRFKEHYRTKAGKEKDTWSLEISGFKNFIKFNKLFRLQHSEKIKKLEKLIKTYKGKATRRLRNELRPQILKVLNKKPASIYEISDILNVQFQSIRHHIFQLSSKGLIFPVNRKKKGNRNVIIWSTTKSNDNNYCQKKFENFSKDLLDELKVPHNLHQLSKKFHRTESDIYYHLKRLEKEKLIKSFRISPRIPFLWMIKSLELKEDEKLTIPQKDLLNLLKKFQLTKKQIAKHLGFSLTKVRYHLYNLRNKGLIKSTNTKPKIWMVK